MLDEPCPDNDACNSAAASSSADKRECIMQDMNLIFESQTQSYNHDLSSGIAKSDNLLVRLREYLTGCGEIDRLLSDDMSTATRDTENGTLLELFKYRIDRFSSMLQMDDLDNDNHDHRRIRFELWSWLATNARALCWVEDNLATAIPYDVVPSLRCVVNAGMNFDTTAILYTMDFFGIMHSTQKLSISKKRRTAIGRRECAETLAFLLNKALPNRCVVRDFLMVLRGACEESQFVRESFRRIVLLGLIGGYETADTRADAKLLCTVLRNMGSENDWVGWTTNGVPNTNEQCDRQSLLIWIVREYLHNCVSDIPTLRKSIHNTHAITVLKQALVVMNDCRAQMMTNLQNGEHVFSNLNLQDCLDSSHGVGVGAGGVGCIGKPLTHHQRQKQRKVATSAAAAATATTAQGMTGVSLEQCQMDTILNTWKLNAMVNELEMYPFEHILQTDMIRTILAFVTGDRCMDTINFNIATRADSMYSIGHIVQVAKECVSYYSNMSSSSNDDDGHASIIIGDIEINKALVDDAAAALKDISRLRKSSIKAQLKTYCQEMSPQRAVFNITVLMCCKQIMCSHDMSVHRIGVSPPSLTHDGNNDNNPNNDNNDNNDNDAGDSNEAASCHDKQNFVQFCPWCNRWQCLFSNIPYKKASPLLGRFVIDGNNRLHCAGADTGKQGAKLDNIVTDAEEEAFATTANDMTNDKREKITTSRFRICKYLPVSRISLKGVAFVSSRWLVSTCVECKRPYVREFTTPSWPRRTCNHCCNATSAKKEKKCEVCMKPFRPKASERTDQGHFMYDNYHTQHSFRSISTCTHCSTRLVNKRKYQHLTLTNSVAAVVRDAALPAFR